MKLINWECLEEMKKMESESIDLIVTSPPYDNLRTYNWTNDWNFETFKPIAKELSRVIKKGWVIVWIVWDSTIKWSETGTSFKQALYFKEIGFNLHDTMIYIKDQLAFPEKNRYYQAFEYMFIFSKWKPKTTNLICDKKNKSFGRKVDKTGCRNKDGSLQFTKSGVGNNIKRFGVRWNYWLYYNQKRGVGHPAIFPEKLAEDHILTWSNEWDIVSDPFMWSWTTWKMALLNNRKFIWIERVEEYFNIAKERLT